MSEKEEKNKLKNSLNIIFLFLTFILSVIHWHLRFLCELGTNRCRGFVQGTLLEVSDQNIQITKQ